MFGEDGVGVEHADAVERPFGDHPLPFAKQVGQHALIGDRQFTLAVGHLETNFQIVAAHQAARLHQSAEPDARAGGDVLLGDIARRIEEHNGIAQRPEHQRDRNRQHRKTAADQNETPPLARHCCGVRMIPAVSPRGRVP